MFDTLPAQVHLAYLAAAAPVVGTDAEREAAERADDAGSGGGGANLNIDGIEQWLADNPVRIIIMVCAISVMARYKDGKIAKSMGSVGILMLGLVLFFLAGVVQEIGKGLADVIT